jgi:hypothetical protein
MVILSQASMISHFEEGAETGCENPREGFGDK